MCEHNATEGEMREWKKKLFENSQKKSNYHRSSDTSAREKVEQCCYWIRAAAAKKKEFMRHNQHSEEGRQHRPRENLFVAVKIVIQFTYFFFVVALFFPQFIYIWQRHGATRIS